MKLTKVARHFDLHWAWANKVPVLIGGREYLIVGFTQNSDGTAHYDFKLASLERYANAQAAR